MNSPTSIETEQILLRVIEQRRAAPPKPPPAPWLFASAMAVSVAISVFAGTILGFIAATQMGYAGTHWTEAVQAHGQLQLLGWMSVFVAALGFEFVVRLQQAPALPTAPRLVVLGLLAIGALVRAAGQLWNDQLGVLWIPGAALILAGALVFAVLIFRVRRPRPLRTDVHPLWFRAAALWLIAASTLGLIAAARAEAGVVALPESHLEVELMLRGFILLSIFAVALRAFPGHLGVEIASDGQQRILFAALNLTFIAYVLGSGAFGFPDSEPLRRIADAAFAATLLLATWWLHVFDVVPRWRGAPRYAVLVPIAWAGLCIYAVALAGAALASTWTGLTLYQDGGVRHIFMLGFIAPLMVAMAHIVLNRFGVGRLYWPNILLASFILLMIAWPLRVLPVLFVPSPGVEARGLLGVAGAVLITGLVCFVAVAARHALAIREAVAAAALHQQHHHHH